MRINNSVIFITFLMSSFQLLAQLGFCQGNSGDLIFTENFGTGTNFGPQLSAAIIPGYGFVGNGGPQDGQYTIASSTFFYGWSLPSDHTIGDTNGKALIVNATFATGDFYVRPISGLCQNTTYEFSAWLINILPITPAACGANGVPINVRFQIWDVTDTTLLASGDTGNIFSSTNPTWDQHALVFQTLPGQTSVILRMINNSVGGCGNDLAIDDIEFKTCGDLIAVEDATNNTNLTICSSETPYTLDLTAIPDNNVFSNHFYQWQESADGMVWNDIAGASNQNITITNITSTSFYRTKVAEVAANLSNLDCITYSDIYPVTVNQAPNSPTLECWEMAAIDNTTCTWQVTGTQPNQPTTDCWETATFNTVTCNWDVTGTQPNQPATDCWETAAFNTATCIWDVTGTQPNQPATDCWETAAFNTATCIWDVTGTQPNQPATDCWETAAFNTATCNWDVTGTQPNQPATDCWETAAFNTATCIWDVTGTQPNQPATDCWETAAFNTATCIWDVTGTQPNQPATDCWETAAFNNAACAWDVTGTQPNQPIIECWETAAFNTVTCTWDVTGTQPNQPATDCWETAAFNNAACAWDVTGTQPNQPATDCWETAAFNTATCIWDVTGTQPNQPIIECWETAAFNTVTCAWDVTGTQPNQPIMECWETAAFNTATCAWELTGTQPNQPIIECWEIAAFNTVTCTWEVAGTQPNQPATDCWETAAFNTATCTWEITGSQTIDTREEFLFLCENEVLTLNANTTLPNSTFLWSDGEQTPSIEVDLPGVYTAEITDGCLVEIVIFNISLEERPVISSVVSDHSSIIITMSSLGSYEYSLDGIIYQTSPVFRNQLTGLYTIYVRTLLCEYELVQAYLHFYIPRFFTPNEDGFNDYFTIDGLELFNTTNISIFDRYGKLLFSAKNTSINWDGTYIGAPLPSSDYWYVLTLDGKEYTGHFTLKR